MKSTLKFPIIICNSFENLYKLDLLQSEEPSKIEENFHLEVNYAYVDAKANNHNEYFLLDVVSFELFDSFLEKIKEDANLASFFLSI